MSLILQNEKASRLTALYCVTMIHAYFKGEHAQTQFRSNVENTKCCGYLQYKVKVIKI